MRFLVQRVSWAAVTVEGKTVGEIGKGFLVFVGISEADIIQCFPDRLSMERGTSLEKEPSMEKVTSLEMKPSMEIVEKMTRKLLGLRIFKDENGKTNLDLKSVGGSLLMISQFTLYADCRKGNRPSFTNAGEPEKARMLYQAIVDLCRQEMEEEHSMEKEPSMEKDESHSFCKVEEGIFGADMKVELVNDGPFTVLLDSDEIIR